MPYATNMISSQHTQQFNMHAKSTFIHHQPTSKQFGGLGHSVVDGFDTICKVPPYQPPII